MDRPLSVDMGDLSLTLDPELVTLFLPFLQSGLKIDAVIGCSVKSFLCDQLGLEPEYLDKRVQTIFVEGKALDNIDTTIIRQGTVIALSAALPGLLAGAHLSSLLFFLNPELPFEFLPWLRSTAIYCTFAVLASIVILLPVTFRRGDRAQRLLPWRIGQDQSSSA